MTILNYATITRFILLLILSTGYAGNVLAETADGDMNVDPAAGKPVEIPAGAVEIKIDTGKRIKGPKHD